MKIYSFFLNCAKKPFLVKIAHLIFFFVILVSGKSKLQHNVLFRWTGRRCRRPSVAHPYMYTYLVLGATNKII